MQRGECALRKDHRTHSDSAVRSFRLSSAQAQPPNNIADVLTYIDNSWDVLTRSPLDCKTVMDVRVPEHSTLYLPTNYPEPASVKELPAKCKITVEALPKVIDSLGSLNMDNLPRQGVLYLPNSYVVPGGFFNEMYGWDSYFIMVGLLRAGRLELARGMVENFFFEIEHYGGILNANRTYFLTRSQPPFLSSMVMALYDALPDPATKRLWLEKSYPFIQRDYEMWTSGEKLAGNTGLSRYLRLRRRPGARDRHHARPLLPRCVSLSPGFDPSQGISAASRASLPPN